MTTTIPEITYLTLSASRSHDIRAPSLIFIFPDQIRPFLRRNTFTTTDLRQNAITTSRTQYCRTILTSYGLSSRGTITQMTSRINEFLTRHPHFEFTNNRTNGRRNNASNSQSTNNNVDNSNNNTQESTQSVTNTTNNTQTTNGNVVTSTNTTQATHEVARSSISQVFSTTNHIDQLTNDPTNNQTPRQDEITLLSSLPDLETTATASNVPSSPGTEWPINVMESHDSNTDIAQTNNTESTNQTVINSTSNINGISENSNLEFLWSILPSNTTFENLRRTYPQIVRYFDTISVLKSLCFCIFSIILRLIDMRSFGRLTPLVSLTVHTGIHHCKHLLVFLELTMEATPTDLHIVQTLDFYKDF